MVSDMLSSQKSNIIREVIIGGIIVVVILVAGTLWSSRSVSGDTESAVRSVSLLYLEELAGRREQVVASTLSGYIGDIDIALGLMDKDDLSSTEKLQAYQARIKQLYGLEKFAFVDSDGIIYTSRGTRSDIDQYSFDYKSMSNPKISIKNIDGNDKKIVIAVPVDNLPFGEKRLVVCFMEMDMTKMLDNVSLQKTSSNTTFCNLYTDKGKSLSDVVLGGLAAEDNLFDALKQANFENVYSLDNMRKDFSDGSKGVISFTYNGVQETMYYIPVHGTNWMLTYLIRESVISEQISSITENIFFRGMLLSILAGFILIAMFVLIITQIRRAAKATLERETAETENRVKQQELEEQLALQEELLAQEQYRTRQDNMIKALSSDYRSVYYLNLDNNEAICYRKSWELYGAAEEGDKFPFTEKFIEYAHRFVTEEYREDFLNFIKFDSIRKGLEKNPIISYSYTVNREGNESYEMLRMARVENKEGEILHFVGVGFTDIDSEIRESMQKNQALSDALKTAEEASRAKTAFLSSMSHEIRTPMNAIIGLDNLALNEPNLSDNTRNFLEKIGTSAKHLLSLINDILDMSRIESGRMIIRNEEFSFSKLLEQINTIFSGQCKEKNLIYNCHVVGEIGDYFIGDNVKLRQILINILGNAVKFTPKGGTVDLIVKRTALFDGKSTIQFSIKDSGIGISKEFLPKIFDAFSQEDATTTNRYGSTGLGLAITKNIVDMMNGKISVDSEKGIGTTFTLVVTLPEVEKKPDEESSEIEVRPQDMNVLVIDDDPIACDHAKLVLEKAGISVETALSGKEALEMIKLRHARRNPYNLMIIDWQMPEMNGLEVTRQIRSIIGDETAIIILTAYNWDDVMEQAISAGVDSFIAKPLFSGNLIEEFKATLKRKSAVLSKKKKAELKGRRVLLAEDMQVNAEIMTMVLQMKEMEVELAENGKIAVEMFEKSKENYYDAILMDVRMPEMDGLEATQTIRKMSRADAKTVPIIALTANAFDEDVQRSLQAGMNAHLSKPVEPEVLFKTLETMIKP